MNPVAGDYLNNFFRFFCGTLRMKSPMSLWADLQAATKNHEVSSVKGLRSRFSDIPCERETMLRTEKGDCLHANFMGKGISERRLIASQYPYSDEHEGGGEAFWMAVFEQSAAIVDLTGPRDQMEPYYPLKEKKIIYPSLEVAWVSTQENLTIYRVAPKGQEARYIARLHFDAWPDYGVVSLKELQELVSKVIFMVPNPLDPVLVHCRAGIGRTGTLVSALVLLDQYNRKELKRENLSEHLIATILTLREQRNPYFVQTPEQFELLLNFALNLFN